MDQPMDQPMEQGALSQAAEAPTQGQMELFSLVSGRAMEALAQDPNGLDAALKADPVAGAVEYGVNALWTVADAADEAGKTLPFEIVIGAGMQVIKALASIANDKGYLADEDIEGFLTQAFQQAVGKYAQMDASAGKIDEASMGKLKQAMEGHGEPDMDQQGGASDGDADNPEPDEDQQGGPMDGDADEQPRGALAAASRR